MINNVFIGLISLTSLILTSPYTQANDKDVQQLVIPYQINTTDQIHFYVVNVLTRVLQITADEYGPSQLVAQDESTVQSRQLRNLNNGLSDVVWMISSAERDAEAQPIQIPVIGGLYGYRVLLVSAQNESADSLELSALSTMTYTQDPDWPDSAILGANQLNLQPSPYRSGFRLVRDGFVDAYPRAAHEAILELNSPIGEGLTIAPDVMMIYDNPLFFYVANSNYELANRIRQGLTRLIDSGELQRLLEAQPFYASAINVMRGRSALTLENPYISHQAQAAMQQYLEPSEALSYVSEIPDAAVCQGDKQPEPC